MSGPDPVLRFVGVQCTTTWCRARVSATYSRRRSSPSSSSRQRALASTNPGEPTPPRCSTRCPWSSWNANSSWSSGSNRSHPNGT
ncbi:Uncharacterised protein [Mycobacteroides abscessus]|nr:Uncharacterised protein [Mycobacteroides abscessus]